MKKRTFTFLIAFSFGLLSYSCSGGQDIVTQMATSTIQEPATITKVIVNSTLTSTPTLPKESKGSNGLITTLGETVNRKGWWPAIPAFSPDGNMIALVSERARLWNTQTLELIYELEKPYLNCYSENVVFSSDGKLLAASIYCIADSNATGHVLIWSTESGVLLHDWEQKFSKNTSKLDGVSNSRPATGIAFLPASSLFAFANGNTIEIKNVRQDSTKILELGEEMIASDITISDDGKFLFAFMDFSYYKTPNRIGQKYAIQVWDLESKNIREKIDFPEPDNTGLFMGHFDVEIKLSDKFLVNIDYINEIFKVKNLETGDTKNLSYRGDIETFISQNTKYIAYLPELDGFDCRNQSIELWDTDGNSSLYIFQTLDKDFGTQWCHGPHTIIFSPDNTALAIAHEERVTLWDVSSFTKQNESTNP